MAVILSEWWLLNQVRADQGPAHAWFLEIAFVQEVGMCVYVHESVSAPRLLKTIHVK